MVLPRRIAARAVLATAIVLLVAAQLVAAPSRADASSAPTAYDAEISLTFPVAGPVSYSDSYAAARAGGARVHMATDIMAPYGAKVHAAMGGTVGFITGLDGGPLHQSGWMVYVNGDDGRTYVYIHLGHQDRGWQEAYVPGLARGVRVERGQHIGYAGCSGNASCTPSGTHLHFEIHDSRVSDPWDSGRMNPYRSLRAAQERGDIADAIGLGLACEGEGYALAGDWDGSGRDGIGWWCDGAVRLRTAGGSVLSYVYGKAGDIPLAGDWDGDGVDTLGIVRDRTWHLTNQHAGGPAQHTFVYGQVSRGDVPIAGDWTGRGRDQIGIIRDGEWHLRTSLSGGPGEIVFTYGRITRGDRPLIGDWTGRGRDQVGIVRDGEWHLRTSLSGGPADLLYVYGRVLDGDAPVMGDWTGQGIATPAIARGIEWHQRFRHAGGAADRVLHFGVG